ncbi:MAG TPA: DUF3822 family protein [Bacteroidia bacterium]|nr:DUF3822 family protein [Bacteroidia bacterium]
MSETSKLPGLQVSFRDTAFDPAAAERYCLVAQVDKERFTLAVLDNISNDFLAFESWFFKKAVTDAQMADQVERLCTDHEWLTNGFKRADVIVTTEKFTFIPAALFDSSAAKEYLAFNVPLTENDRVRNDVLRQTDARAVYAIDSKLENALLKISPTIRVRHHLTPLTEKVLAASKNQNEKRMHAHIRQGQFDLIISDNGQLLLSNVFTFQSGEDFIYFLLFAGEQLKLNPEKFDLEISGEVEEKSSIALMAKKYVRNIRYAERPSGVRFSPGFEQFPAHYHFNLFALHFFS